MKTPTPYTYKDEPQPYVADDPMDKPAAKKVPVQTAETKDKAAFDFAWNLWFTSKTYELWDGRELPPETGRDSLWNEYQLRKKTT
jgi:hypothetical protein